MSKLTQINAENVAVLSKLQKQFNSNIEKVNNLKIKYEAVKNEIQLIQAKIVSDIIPLERKMLDIQIKETIYLDAFFQENIFKKRDNEMLSTIILERATTFLEKIPLKELEEIYRRHNNGISYEEEKVITNEEILQNIKEKFSTIFGMEFEEDADLSTPEKFQEYVDKILIEENEAYEFQHSNRKKSNKQIEKEIRKRQEEKNLNKTSRQIYMELVKEFHPDKEKNELEKEKKTLVMHKIMDAYQKDDLFELLRLRLELLGTDFEHTNDEQLKYYVKLLKQQVDKLQIELDELLSFGKSSFFSPSLYDRFGSDGYISMESKFKKETAQLKIKIKNAEKQLPFFRSKIQVEYLIEEFRREQKKSAETRRYKF